MARHAVILAGGSGTRFWPLSREQAPKQLLNVFGKNSLLIDTLERADEIVGKGGQMHIVVGKPLFDELHNHILAHEKWGDAPLNYIIEPHARNTAPALALAAYTIVVSDEDAVIAMLPSDHLAENGEQWVATMETAFEAAEDGSLVTIGLRPTAPETGFGYIRTHQAPQLDAGAYEVDCFVEKPDLTTAQGYLEQGGHYWNSGMLVARADAILSELKAVQETHPDVSASSHNSEMVGVCKALTKAPESSWLHWLFEKLPSESFDKAVLELSDKVKVIPTTIGWSDVGSLLALEALQEPNAQGTRIIGQGVDIDSVNTTNYSTNRLVATLGLNDLIVVDTEDATLVAAKDRIQDVRQIVSELHQRGAPEIKQSQTSIRPWGSWTIRARGIGYQVKEVEVMPGCSLSLQKHEQRSEHWVVIEGTASVEIEGQTQKVLAGQSVFIPVGTLHRLSNEGDSLLRITEIAVGNYLGEDDIERFDDEYGR